MLYITNGLFHEKRVLLLDVVCYEYSFEYFPDDFLEVLLCELLAECPYVVAVEEC